ncbi:HNH endonuclease [Mucilaginibacter sp. AW1-3]
MTLDDNERSLIATAVAKGGDVWNDPTLDGIKQKIKDYYLGPDDGRCCYCRERFRAVHRMGVDLEHILPKSIFNDFMFEIFNLNISCKRCNMSIKRNRTDFLVDASTIRLRAQQSDQYQFIHPNLDIYRQHMSYVAFALDDQDMVKYTPLKPKGQYTYDFFRLYEKEVNSFNLAQGIKGDESEVLLPDQPLDIQHAAEALIERL